jgi:hypothetical protein
MQTVIHTKDGYLYHKCPGCKGAHTVPVLQHQKAANKWNWNGDLTEPSVLPSVKHTYPESFYEEHPKARRFCCHYFISGGVIEYCGDSSHDMSGQKVPLPIFGEQEVAEISQSGE